RRRHTRFSRDWSSDVCSSDLTVKEACRRLVGTEVIVTGQPLVWDMVPYDVQLIGGIALHQGKVAEMATGEGKTLVATMPLYLNRSEERRVGKGCRVRRTHANR